jgi:hypothetical protein
MYLSDRILRVARQGRVDRPVLHVVFHQTSSVGSDPFESCSRGMRGTIAVDDWVTHFCYEANTLVSLRREVGVRRRDRRVRRKG